MPDEGGTPSRAWSRTRQWASSFTFLGIIMGAVFFALSLTPSLLPRSSIIQGILSGITAAFGYGIGTGVSKLWRYLEIPEPPADAKVWIRRVAYAAAAIVVAGFLAYLVSWNNDLRRIFGMDTVNDVFFPVVVCGAAIVVALLFVLIARLCVRAVRWLMRLGERLLPPRLGRVLGAAVGALLIVFLLSGVLVDALVGMANRAFSVQNGTMEAGVEQPTTTLRSGGPDSLVSWESIGRPGRKWIARGPTAQQIDEFSGGGATDPIRVYVGLDSAGTVAKRAQLALDELIRTDAFERAVLVLATSTGSGGIDPKGTAAVEYMHNGDTAIAGFQYSFLPSWISYFVDQAAAKESATVFFETVHDYWRRLDPDERPDFYLFGVSLGSFGSEASVASIRTYAYPIDGAVWAGPTFMNEGWAFVTDHRDGGSPAWLPEFDDGTVIRFTGRGNDLDAPDGEWGEDRFAYIQHPSDPVTFFSFDLLWSEPATLRGPRSPETSSDMWWFPGVTFWQVAADLPLGGSVPPGYGHNFGVPSYVWAWAGVTEPAGWTAADSERLIEFLENADL